MLSVLHQGAQDINGPDALCNALQEIIMKDKVVVLNVQINRNKECDGFNTNFFKGFLSSISSVTYSDFVENDDGSIVRFNAISHAFWCWSRPSLFTRGA